MSVPGEIAIRRATTADAESAVDLRIRVVDEGIWMGTEPPVDRAVAETAFQSYVDSDDKGVFVAGKGA